MFFLLVFSESQEVHKTYGAGTHPLQQIASSPPSAKDVYGEFTQANRQIPSLTFVDLWWISLLILFLSTATDKVALLIGNMNYIYHTQLCAPISDVHELTNLLRQLDFKVVSLLDLNWQEMHSAVTEFLLLLDKGVYGTSAAYVCPI